MWGKTGHEEGDRRPARAPRADELMGLEAIAEVFLHDAIRAPPAKRALPARPRRHVFDEPSALRIWPDVPT